MITQDRKHYSSFPTMFFTYVTQHPCIYQQSSVFSCRFSTSFAYYGLAMDLQKFGVSQQSTYGTCW